MSQSQIIVLLVIVLLILTGVADPNSPHRET